MIRFFLWWKWCFLKKIALPHHTQSLIRQRLMPACQKKVSGEKINFIKAQGITRLEARAAAAAKWAIWSNYLTLLWMGKRGFFHEGKITPKRKMYLPILLTFPFSILEMKLRENWKYMYLFFDDNHYDGFCFPAREHDDERKIELKLFLTDKCFGKLAYQPHPIDKWRRNHSYFMNIESNIADVNREVCLQALGSD